jgi:hypothetical protein
MEEIHLLLRENILPRLDNMEAQLKELREVTWPYVQAKRDQLGLDTRREQQKLLRWIDLDEVRMLLRRKLYWLHIYEEEMVEEELQQILVT